MVLGKEVFEGFWFFYVILICVNDDCIIILWFEVWVVLDLGF